MRDRLLYGLTAVALIAMGVGLYMALIYAGTDRLQGEVQRIFYIHFAAFYSAFLSFIVSVVASIVYLRKRDPKWDVLSLASIEVGFMLSILMVVTGMIWARPIWNTWWTWGPRLTSTVIMLLTYAAYLMFRNGIENIEFRRRFAAVYSILAMTTVIFTIIVIRIRPDTMYSGVIGPSIGTAANSVFMSEGIVMALTVNTVVWCFFIAPVLIWWRVRLENLREHVQYTYMQYLMTE